METVEQTEKDSGVVLIGNSIVKCYREIVTKQQKNEDPGKEIESLKGLLSSGGKTSSLLTCQAFVRLCDEGLMNSDKILTLLMPFVPNSSLTQFCSLVTCVIDLLLVDLRHQIAMKSLYKCPYQIVQLQHPIILLLPSQSKNKPDDSERLNVILEAIMKILNSHDRRIYDNSTEFLKPVLLTLFTNQVYSSQLWKSLLERGRKGDFLYQEIILWSKLSNTSTILHTNQEILLKASKYFLNQRDDGETLSIALCLITSSIALVDEGFSIDSNLDILLKLIFEIDDFGTSIGNIMIMLLADLLQIVSPFDLPQLLRILSRLIIQKQHGNSLSLFMVLDGLIQRAAYPSFASESLSVIEEIITFVSTKDTKKRFFDDCGEKIPSSYIFFSEKIATYFEFDYFLKSIGHFTKEIVASAKSFFSKYPLILRAMFLSSQLRYDAWLEVFNQLLKINETSKSTQNTWIMPYLYKIANEMHPKTKNLLIKNLTAFGQKDPVVNTIKVLAPSIGKSYAIDLYLRLWKKEPRTYPFLQEALKVKSGGKEENYELLVTKGFAIKAICELRPSQHGGELVQNLSEILNDGDDFELPIILTLETLGSLCENHVVNIVSTWKAISFKFRYEKRPRVLKSLFRFFGKVPLLKNPMDDFHKFSREVLEKLWANALHNSENNMDVCSSAIQVIGQFSLESLTLAEIPEVLKKSFKKPEKADDLAPDISETDIIAPPEIWLRLMEQVYRYCIDAVSDVVSSHIAREITVFRGGVYAVPEGKPEPKDMKSLPEKSILRCVVQFLIQQARQQTADDYVICGLLKSLTPKFSKAMPPLDWSFLHEFFHNGQEIKHNCLRVLGNQLSISGSARRMVENYINNFDANNFQEEDIAVLYEKLPELSDYIAAPVFTQFFRKSMAYANSPESSHLLLDHILTSLSPAISRDSCDTRENFECLCVVVEKNMQTLDISDEIFEKFTKLAKMLPLKNLDRMIVNGLEGKTVTMFKKSLVIITETCTPKSNQNTDSSITLENSLNWITQAVERANKESSSFQPILLEKLIEIFGNFRESSKAFKWVSELLAKIQNVLTSNSEKKTGSATTLAVMKMDDCLFLIDVFLTTIITLAGYGFLMKGCLENNIERNCRSYRLFPQSLSQLLITEIWKDNQGRVFEFLYHFFLHPCIPETYAETFKNAIFCCKNHSYFQQIKVWQRFVMMRR